MRELTSDELLDASQRWVETVPFALLEFVGDFPGVGLEGLRHRVVTSFAEVFREQAGPLATRLTNDAIYRGDLMLGPRGALSLAPLCALWNGETASKLELVGDPRAERTLFPTDDDARVNVVLIGHPNIEDLRGVDRFVSRHDAQRLEAAGIPTFTPDDLAVVLPTTDEADELLERGEDESDEPVARLELLEWFDPERIEWTCTPRDHGLARIRMDESHRWRYWLCWRARQGTELAAETATAVAYRLAPNAGASWTDGQLRLPIPLSHRHRRWLALLARCDHRSGHYVISREAAKRIEPQIRRVLGIPVRIT